ncbi:MAG: S8 family serine peptidase, partial [Thaumarchaeota archaeon]|nr:S8 family serine peptidase [Nitrososphaerota archaeon]
MQTPAIKRGVIDSIGKNKIKHDFGNVVSATVNKGDLKKLESDARIESIELVGVKHILLQGSVPLINATTTKSLTVNGINLTGLGQTVCVIDTGVNYSHSDLGGCYGNNNAASACKILGGWDYCADDVSCTTEDNIPNDVHGHGTHVSGIISANGSIKGVAPDTKLVVIKVCDSTGTYCSDDDIQAGINWCVNNASTFNISAISISLGGGSYSNYCNSDQLASSINSAVGQSISVVIATGNSGSSTKISSPACVQNATPVSSTTKTDAISSFSNRNSLVQLMAPGGTNPGTGTCTATTTDENRICSSYYDGSYIAMSGTSMATPHVSASVAIINQFLRSTGQNKTPQQIASTLNSTGKQIYDSSSGLYFSRINLYSAIISLDITNPNVTLISPINSLETLNQSQTFRCNATDLSLKNMTFYLWNSSGTYHQTSQNISGNSHSFEANLTNIPISNYNWNCLYYDENSNSAFATSNFSLMITRLINITLISPGNATLSNSTNQTFTCNASSNTTLSNITLYIWNSTGVLNTNTTNVNGTSNQSSFNYTLTQDGNYTWNCMANTTSGDSSFASANYTLSIDSSIPSITAVSNSTTDTAAYISWNTSEAANASVAYGTNSTNLSSNATNVSFVTFRNISLSNLTPNTTYYYNVTSCDQARSCNTSGTYNFTTLPDITPPTLNFTASTDSNNVFVSRNWTYINVTAVDSWSNISTCLLQWTNNTGTTNITMTKSANGTSIFCYYNYTNLSDGTYNYTIFANDTRNNIGNTSRRNITLDTTPPTINLISPNSTNQTNSTVTFRFNTTDLLSPTMSCALYINGTYNQTISSVLNSTNTTFNATLAEANYNWNISCNDSANNTGNSSALNFTVNIPPTIIINSPTNTSQTYEKTSDTISINYTFNETFPVNITIYLLNTSGSVINS